MKGMIAFHPSVASLPRDCWRSRLAPVSACLRGGRSALLYPFHRRGWYGMRHGGLWPVRRRLRCAPRPGGWLCGGTATATARRWSTRRRLGVAADPRGVPAWPAEGVVRERAPGARAGLQPRGRAGTEPEQGTPRRRLEGLTSWRPADSGRRPLGRCMGRRRRRGSGRRVGKQNTHVLGLEVLDRAHGRALGSHGEDALVLLGCDKSWRRRCSRRKPRIAARRQFLVAATLPRCASTWSRNATHLLDDDVVEHELAHRAPDFKRVGGRLFGRAWYNTTYGAARAGFRKRSPLWFH